MKVANILFTYNRPLHTFRVLEALRNNTIIPEKLYIFHDGKKKNTDQKLWDEVEKIIREVTWCDCEVVTSQDNIGLANSVIHGVTTVFTEYDAVIVLEDDCVPHRLFMDYMLQSLQKYKDHKTVYSIGATAETVKVPSNGYDAYFSGRIRSTGWATWKDRWQSFCKDYEIVKRIKRDPELRSWLMVWGQDLGAMLCDNIMGRVDSWAVFWALNVIEHKGLALTPYNSLIDNIGFDNTGIHSGGIKPDLKPLPEDKEDIFLPDEVEVVSDYEKIYTWFFPWNDPLDRDLYYKRTLSKWLDIKDKGRNLSDWFVNNHIVRIYIWGLGDLGKRIICEIVNTVEIIAIIDMNPRCDQFNGIRLISNEDIEEGFDRIVVIPGYDIMRIKRIIRDEYIERLITVDQLMESIV